MKALSMAIVALALTALSWNAQAAQQVDYIYTPAEGVHEVKYFHGCYDGTDVTKRTKVHVTMAGLNLEDVLVETKPHENNKPSTELVTFRLKNKNASFTVQFRSNDGPHCQQGVQSIVFNNVTLHNYGQLNARR